jgi:RNA polymerase sigma factor (sigma-70 family)
MALMTERLARRAKGRIATTSGERKKWARDFPGGGALLSVIDQRSHEQFDCADPDRQMISAVVLRTQPDVKLARLAAAGSEAAFEAIVHRYRRVLLCYCRRSPLSESRSEDVVQQALLNAWTALRAGTEVREMRSWLYRITHNQAISALRRSGYDFEELSEAVSVSEDLDRGMLIRETLAAVAALPDLQREAIVRTAVDGRS